MTVNRLRECKVSVLSETSLNSTKSRLNMVALICKQISSCLTFILVLVFCLLAGQKQLTKSSTYSHLGLFSFLLSLSLSPFSSYHSSSIFARLITNQREKESLGSSDNRSLLVRNIWPTS